MGKKGDGEKGKEEETGKRKDCSLTEKERC